MVIKYDIPNGTMKIDLAVYFRDAGMRQIRRMFKQLPSIEEYLPEIREYLKEQMENEKNRAAKYAQTYAAQYARVTELEEQYQEMRNPCYAVCTTNKVELNEARNTIRDAKTDLILTKKNAETARKLFEKYQGIMADVERLLV